MSLPELRPSSSLEQIWDDLVFSEAQLKEEAFASTLAPRMTALVERCDAIQAKKKKLRREEIGANAKVASLNRRLDSTTTKFDLVLLGACGKDRKSPLYRRYVADTLTGIVRLGLGSQVEACKGWPTLLLAEKDPALQAYAPLFEALFAEAKAALEAREKAQLDRQVLRSREIEPLVEDANATRLSLFGHLTQYAAENHLGKDWARSFFPAS